MIGIHTALDQQLLQIPQVPADRQNDHLGRNRNPTNAEDGGTRTGLETATSPAQQATPGKLESIMLSPNATDPNPLPKCCSIAIEPAKNVRILFWVEGKS